MIDKPCREIVMALTGLAMPVELERDAIAADRAFFADGLNDRG
jgi:hypothetical protein